MVGGGPALPGSQLEYTVTVRNVAVVPAYGVVITDDLDAATPGLLALRARLRDAERRDDGRHRRGHAHHGRLLRRVRPARAECVGRAALPRHDRRRRRDRARPSRTPAWSPGTRRRRRRARASRSTWAARRASACCAARVWHDADFDDVLDAQRAPASRAGPSSCSRNGQLVQSVRHRRDGTYRIGGVAPNVANGDAYVLRFRAPGAGARTASLGIGDSPFTNGPQQISDIVVPSGEHPAEPEPADRPERRRLRRARAHADRAARRSRCSTPAARSAAARVAASTIRCSRARSRGPTASTSST